jgi:hypothetical protein
MTPLRLEPDQLKQWVELRGLEPLTLPCHGGSGSLSDGLRALIECRDTQALPPPFRLGASQFAPHIESGSEARPAQFGRVPVGVDPLAPVGTLGMLSGE